MLKGSFVYFLWLKTKLFIKDRPLMLNGLLIGEVLVENGFVFCLSFFIVFGINCERLSVLLYGLGLFFTPLHDIYTFITC